MTKTSWVLPPKIGIGDNRSAYNQIFFISFKHSLVQQGPTWDEHEAILLYILVSDLSQLLTVLRIKGTLSVLLLSIESVNTTELVALVLHYITF